MKFWIKEKKFLRGGYTRDITVVNTVFNKKKIYHNNHYPLLYSK